MTKHYENEAAAVASLQARGWKELNTGAWVTKCRKYRATIHPTPTKAVAVFISEID